MEHREGAAAAGALPFRAPPIAAEAPPAYAQFWALWQEESFYACHEVLEELWRESAGDDRLFYNGLIHCAVAIYQHRRGNPAGAARQLLRAQVKLERFAPVYNEVDVAGLLAGVAHEIAASLDTLTQRQRSALDLLRDSLREQIAAPGAKQSPKQVCRTDRSD